MQIRGKDVQVDILQELEPYMYLFKKAKITDERLISCSPFRSDDSRPSFFIRLKASDGHVAGLWGDSGAIDQFYDKGNFTKLYAFLHGVDLETAEELLLEQYGGTRTSLTWRPLPLQLHTGTRYLPESILADYTDQSDYLQKRKISKEVVALFGVGYSKKHRAIAIPWRKANGKLVNVKYRKTNSKQFYYEKDGTPIRDLIWGIDKIYEKQCEVAVLCEAEIDALTSWTYGVPSIAVGGSTFSEKRAEILLKSPIKRLIIATDNDGVGRKLRETIVKRMNGLLQIEHVYIPDPYKDVNDLPIDSFVQLLQHTHKESYTFLKK